MKAEILSDDIFRIPNFFDGDACKDLIALSETIGYEKAAINAGEGQQRVVESVRNNQRILFKNEELADSLWNKLKNYIPARIENIEAIGLNELFRFYKYEHRQTFRKHRDESYFRNALEASYYTFMIYLNDDFEGGETAFNDIVVKPEMGSAIIFLHQLEHEGKPVQKGIKYVLRTDVMYKFVG